MSEPDYEVGIIGASLAGSTTALRLAQEGIRTVVFEKQKQAHRSCCGEGLSERGIFYLEKLGLAEATARLPHMQLKRYEIRLGDRMFRIPCAGKQYTMGIQRSVLDREIHKNVSLSANADLHFCFEVEHVVRVPGGFRLDSGGNSVTVKRLVLAAGASTPLAWQLGLTTGQRIIPRFGMNQHMQASFETAPDAIQIILQPDHEIYCTPVAPDCMNVAILGGKDIAHHFQSYIASTTAQARRTALPVDNVCGAANAYTYTSGTIPGLYTIGDTRERFDPIGGMGMTFALASGLFAAEALTAELREGACAHAVQREFEKRAATEAAIARMFTRSVYYLLKNRMRKALLPVATRSGLAGWVCKRLSTPR